MAVDPNDNLTLSMVLHRTESAPQNSVDYALKIFTTSWEYQKTPSPPLNLKVIMGQRGHLGIHGSEALNQSVSLWFSDLYCLCSKVCSLNCSHVNTELAVWSTLCKVIHTPPLWCTWIQWDELPLELCLSIYCRESINNWADLGYIKLLTMYSERKRI